MQTYSNLYGPIQSARLVIIGLPLIATATFCFTYCFLVSSHGSVPSTASSGVLLHDVTPDDQLPLLVVDTSGKLTPVMTTVSPQQQAASAASSPQNATPDDVMQARNRKHPQQWLRRWQKLRVRKYLRQQSPQ